MDQNLVSFLENRFSILFLLVVFIALVPLISAQEIEIDYPEQVDRDEEFFVDIELVDFENDIYDVKIDITGGGERISQISIDGTWRSTFYYYNKALAHPDKQKKFKLKVDEYAEDAEMVIKIRDSDDNSVEFKGYSIDIVSSDEQGSEEDEEGSNGQEPEDKDEVSDNTEEIKVVDSEGVSSLDLEEQDNSKVQDSVTLVTKTIKSDKNSEEEQDNLILYGFILFVLILLVLYFIHFRKKKKLDFENE